MKKHKVAPAKQKAAQAKDKVSKAKQKVARSKQKVVMPQDKVAIAGRKGVHIGYTLGRLLQKMKLTTGDLAALLGISGQSVRRMLRKKYLHALTLVKISEVLNHDVLRYLYLPDDLPGNAALKQRMEELEKENEGLKEKVVMLEKMVKLLEKG